MRSTALYGAALLAGAASALPTLDKRDDFSDFSPHGKYFPLANGFPNTPEHEVILTEKQAFGTLSNAPPPKSISEEAKTNLKLVALNEQFEVAFFSELVYNLTNKVHGYDLGYGQEYVVDALQAILAQEQLHALNANNQLKKFEEEPIEPCRYSFPVTDFQSAIKMAGGFTDLVLGTLQDLSIIYAKGGDFGLVRSTAATIGNEAEQESFYRLIQKKRPSAKPFLTTGAREFAFSAIKRVVLKGSCPNVSTIPLKELGELTVVTSPLEPRDQNIQFSFSQSEPETSDTSSLRLVFLNGVNLPIVKPLNDVNVVDNKVTFSAPFPYTEFVMNGMTIAAVVKGEGPFASADEVAKAALLGPGLIEVD